MRPITLVTVDRFRRGSVVEHGYTGGFQVPDSPRRPSYEEQMQQQRYDEQARPASRKSSFSEYSQPTPSSRRSSSYSEYNNQQAAAPPSSQSRACASDALALLRPCMQALDAANNGSSLNAADTRSVQSCLKLLPGLLQDLLSSQATAQQQQQQQQQASASRWAAARGGGGGGGAAAAAAAAFSRPSSRHSSYSAPVPEPTREPEPEPYSRPGRSSSPQRSNSRDWREAEDDWLTSRNSPFKAARVPTPEPQPEHQHHQHPQQAFFPPNTDAAEIEDDWYARQQRNAPTAYTAPPQAQSAYEPPSRGFSPPTPEPEPEQQQQRDAEEDWIAQRAAATGSRSRGRRQSIGMLQEPAEVVEQDRLKAERERQERSQVRRMSVGMGMGGGVMTIAAGAAAVHSPSNSPSKRAEEAYQEQRKREIAVRAVQAFNSLPGTTIPIDKPVGEHWKTTLKLKKAREQAAAEREETARFLQGESRWKGVPAWKRALLERRAQDKADAEAPQREAEERQRREEEKFYSMPSWKQALVIAKRNGEY